MTRLRFTRLLIANAGVVVLALLAPRAAGAQTGVADPRWHAWIGCWSSAQNGLTGAAARICVVPAPGASAVDLVTITRGSVASRERIEANGERRTTERDGCTGWETARWSADSRRVYVQSEHQCAAGAKRSSEGLITMSPDGNWLDVVSVTMGENTGVRVLRHRPTVEPTDLPADVAAALRTVPPPRVRDARTAAAAPLAIADIVDASHQVSSGVVTTWLNDVRQDIPVNAKRLVELAAAGVPDRAIDMMVALAYPKAFSVPPSPTTVGLLLSNEPRQGGGGGGLVNFGGLDDCTSSFSVFGFGDCAPFARSPYGYSPFGFSPFGYLGFGSSSYSPFEYGYGPYSRGYGFGPYDNSGGWYANGPAVVLITPATTATHGQVVNGRGYTAGDSGSTASSSGSTSSGSSSGSSGGSIGASSGGDGGRSAVPR